MKYICKDCVKPCEIIVEDGSDIPFCCPYDPEVTPDWQEVDETLQPDLQDKQKSIQDSVVKFCDAMDKGKKNVANATCNFGNLPDWCKVGEWVYCDNNDFYTKIVEINDKEIIGENGKGAAYFSSLKNLHSTRLRPYNDEEMKSLVGKILTLEENKNLHMVTDYFNETDEDDPDYHYCTVYVGGDRYVASELLGDFTIDNSPCGVLEHLENGEWVE